MLKKLILVVLLLVIALLAYATTLPDSFRVRRGLTLQAPHSHVFALVDDLRAWRAWSPWSRLDPAMKVTYGGPATGRGATYDWEGNSDVGRGRMEIIDSTPPDRVVIKLDFFAPFEAHNTTVFTFEDNHGATNVTWTMSGPSPLLSKLMQVFMPFDEMIGKDFEQGLANLKAVAEK